MLNQLVDSLTTSEYTPLVRTDSGESTIINVTMPATSLTLTFNNLTVEVSMATLIARQVFINQSGTPEYFCSFDFKFGFNEALPANVDSLMRTGIKWI